VTTGGGYVYALDAQGAVTWAGTSGTAPPTDRLYRAVSTTGFTSCGIPIKRSLECWPRNYFPANDWGTYSALDSAFGVFCALGIGGSLRCGGDNTSLVTTVPAGSYSAMSIGSGFACAITKAGAVVCWGTSAPAQSPSTGVFIGIAAGSSHVCAIKSDHTVACWGSNVSREAQPPSGTFAAIAAGTAFTCGIRTDGTLSCWGRALTPSAPSGSFLPPTSVQSCADGEACAGPGGQSGVCYAGACCTGCFFYNACEVGTDAGASGLNGASCNACPGTCGGNAGWGTSRNGTWSNGACNNGVCGFGEAQCCGNTGDCGTDGCA
jgi:hypothetical protein